MGLTSKTIHIITRALLGEIYKLRELTEIAPDSKYFEDKLKETEEAYNQILKDRVINKS